MSPKCADLRDSLNEVHQALVVMYADTGKLLNYRQLMRSV